MEIQRTQKDYLQIQEVDNVIVALQDLSEGTKIILENGKELEVLEAIPKGHKVALQDMDEQTDIIKYGYPIGHLTEAVKKGEWVHTHNLKTNLSGILEYEYKPVAIPTKFNDSNKTFQGFRRKNGDVGIRNDLYIVPTVGCINGLVERFARDFEQEVDHSFDHIHVLSHPYGCSQLGDDHEMTKEILGNMVLHPNAAGVLVVGLGCENNIIEEFRDSLGDYDEERIKFISLQSVLDEKTEVQTLINAIHDIAKDDEREEIPLSELRVGLKCGGSDGFSGITGNPLQGAFSDYLVAAGGSVVLTEVPEMFGAEKILMERAKDEATFEDIVELINNFKAYFLKYNQPVYENPSPGNKDGGISTLEDKSLGCTQKAGTTQVMDVIPYGGIIKEKGLTLLNAPGNDLVSSTALASSHAHLVLFSTGRGTPFGTYVPTVKISTNSQLFENKPSWIDFDAGRILRDGMEVVLNDFIEEIIAIASGKATNNESNGFSQIAIFKDGVTL